MLTPLQIFQQRFAAALHEFVENPAAYAEMVKPTQDAKHGDYQANCAMPIAKLRGGKPRDIAQEIIGRLQIDDVAEPPEIAGPGFINVRLKSAWLAERLRQMATDDHLGAPVAESPRTVVIDYSSPNVAKPMHVGHLRSTIIGDALARVLRFLGEHVITDNHLGDWGMQFGMLLYGYKHFVDRQALEADPVRELTRIYVQVRSLMAEKEEDAEETANPVAQAARAETARLHEGDPENVKLWQMFMPWCLREIDRIYERLDVHFDHTLGESFYQPMLPDVVKDLLAKHVAQETDQGTAIFFEGDRPPAFVRKLGAFTYTTTDLATVRYRLEQWHANVVLYVVDARQALHFRNLFEAAKRWGYEQVEMQHISFGSVLGADRTPIKTREGGAVELGALLDEAVERAGTVYDQARRDRQERGEEVPELGADERRQLTEIVGIGAVKYADLSQNRTSDYVFNWDKMLAMDGNTAAYMQYAYVRNRGIFRKAGADPERFRTHPPEVVFPHPAERQLGVQLVRFGEAVRNAAAEYKPHLITVFLWDLAKTYSIFNQNCPVLRAESDALRQSRLLLCDLTARTIQTCLHLLGIKTVERM